MRVLWTAAAAAAVLVPGNIAQAAGGGGSSGGGMNFVEMDRFDLPIIDNDRLDGVLHMKLVLEAHDPEALAHAQRQLPVLRAAAVSTGLEFARLYASNFRPVDVEKLAHDLDVALQQVDPGIARVLVVEVAAMAS